MGFKRRHPELRYQFRTNSQEFGVLSLELRYQFRTNSQEFGVLSLIPRIFDPLGLLTADKSLMQ